MPPSRPLLRSQADLEAAWREAMQPLGWSGSSLWLMLIEADRRPLHLIEVAEVPDAPGPGVSWELGSFLEHLGRDFVEPGGSVAFLRARPGAGLPDERDRAWAATLYDACRRADMACEVVHVATDVDVRPLPVDALRAPWSLERPA
ncbi:hypothetical protein GCM10027026_26870 [Myroides odoratimimus subsp. xuanwuensis]